MSYQSIGFLFFLLSLPLQMNTFWPSSIQALHNYNKYLPLHTPQRWSTRVLDSDSSADFRDSTRTRALIDVTRTWTRQFSRTMTWTRTREYSLTMTWTRTRECSPPTMTRTRTLTLRLGLGLEQVFSGVWCPLSLRVHLRGEFTYWAPLFQSKDV